MTNAAQEAPQPVRSSHRTLIVVALVTICLAALLNFWMMSHGKTVRWSSWALLCGLAASTGAVAARNRSIQNILKIAAILLVIAAVYGAVRG